jgi:transcriptional antiterminator NusG
MEDEIRQDGTEGEIDAVAETADPDRPEARGETSNAEASVESALEDTAAVASADASSSGEPVGAPEQESQAASEQPAAEAQGAGSEEIATMPPQPEVPAVSEGAPEPVIEPIAERAVETDQAEPRPADGDQMPVVEAEPAATEAPQAEAQVSQAPTAAMGVQPEAEESASEIAPAQTAEVEDDRHWYVVHCYSGYENKVRHNLEQRIESMGMKDKIFDVVVPTEEEIEVKEGKRRTVERRVFPGYILVQMIMTEESWYVVRNTPGVTGFVGMGNEPTPLRPEEVAQIIRRMEAEAPRVKVTYKIDQKVRIIDGPFNDFIGTVDDIDMERAKVRVMVSFFGRETPVELDFLQVEKA